MIYLSTVLQHDRHSESRFYGMKNLIKRTAYLIVKLIGAAGINPARWIYLTIEKR